jgi:hypothetical protein
MELRHLRYLTAAAEEGSVMLAADGGEFAALGEITEEHYGKIFNTM